MRSAAASASLLGLGLGLGLGTLGLGLGSGGGIATHTPATNNTNTSTNTSSTSGSTSSGTTRLANSADESSDDITEELLQAFSPTGNDPSGANRLDISNIVSVIRMAQNLGIADATMFGDISAAGVGDGERVKQRICIFCCLLQ